MLVRDTSQKSFVPQFSTKIGEIIEVLCRYDATVLHRVMNSELGGKMSTDTTVEHGTQSALLSSKPEPRINEQKEEREVYTYRTIGQYIF